MENRTRSVTVPDWVSKQYYRHGLFCASHPRLVLALAVIAVLYASSPLLTIPIYISRAQTYSEAIDADGAFPKQKSSHDGTRSDSPTPAPSWRSQEPPVAYVQQVIMKAMIHPYRKELIITDAFRGPLASAFKLHLQDIASFHDKKR